MAMLSMTRRMIPTFCTHFSRCLMTKINGINLDIPSENFGKFQDLACKVMEVPSIKDRLEDLQMFFGAIVLKQQEEDISSLVTNSYELIERSLYIPGDRTYFNLTVTQPHLFVTLDDSVDETVLRTKFVENIIYLSSFAKLADLHTRLKNNTISKLEFVVAIAELTGKCRGKSQELLHEALDAGLIEKGDFTIG